MSCCDDYLLSSQAGSGDRVAVTLVDIDIQKEEVSVQVAGIGTRRLADLVVLLNDTYSTKVPLVAGLVSMSL